MYSYSTNVLFLCRLCKDSFQLIDDFIEHKKEEHSVEFRTSNCIVFEDILILNTCNDEEKNCGTLLTVTEKGNPVPSLNVPSVKIENNLTEVDLSHSHEPIPHDPADAFDPFPTSTSDYLNDDNHKNLSYQDNDETSHNSFQPNDDDYEAFDLPQASADISVNCTEPKMEWTEFESDREINQTASYALTQGPQNPNVLLKKLSSEEIQNYSRLRNQDTVQAAAQVTSESRCKLCLKNFNSEAELEIHWRFCELEYNERHLYCSPCKMVFTSKWAKNIHSMTLHGTEDERRELCTLKCYICQKPYSRNDLLIRHLESHKETVARNKPFKCNQCNASFFSKSYLLRHQSSHSFARPFQCPEPDCGKAFKHKNHLGQHFSLIHINSGKSHKEANSLTRPFKCDECSSSFIAEHHLRRHQASHALPRIFQCTEPGCEKAFKRESHLRLHLKYLHSNILELFKCREPNCTKAFTRKESLGRHLRMCHKTK